MEGDNMRNEIRLQDAMGKTLEGFDFSFTCRQAVLTFTDGTFTTLGIDMGYEAGDERVKESTLEIFNFGHEKLFRLGILTKDEMEEKTKEKDERFREGQERRERGELERLRRKYEASS